MAMGYTGDAVAQCAQHVEREDYARRMAFFSYMTQNPALRWNNIQAPPAPAQLPVPGRVTCQYVGNQLQCITQR